MAADRVPVVFIHGLWLHSTSWQPWAELFRSAGYDPVMPEWPGVPDTVAEARAHPESQAGIGIDQVVVKVCDVVVLVWKTEDAQRALPAEITEVEQGAVIRWRMRATGPAEASQRRKAVRGRVSVPITAEYGSIELKGETVDLSEAGLRADFNGLGAPPEAGAKVDLFVALEDGLLRTKAEVVRTQARGAQWVMSIRFVNIQEKDQDRVRRRVFQALREERAKRADDAPPDLRG